MAIREHTNCMLAAQPRSSRRITYCYYSINMPTEIRPCRRARTRANADAPPPGCLLPLTSTTHRVDESDGRRRAVGPASSTSRGTWGEDRRRLQLDRRDRARRLHDDRDLALPLRAPSGTCTLEPADYVNP